MSSKSGKRKRVTLSISAKLELIQKLESGASVASVCEEYGIKKQTVSDIRMNKEKLKVFAARFGVTPDKDNHIGHMRKSMRVADNKELEEAIYTWYEKQRSDNVHVRGAEILNEAKKLADSMGLDFKGSSGWLWRFRNRHGLCNKVVQDQSGTGSADLSSTEQFHSKLEKFSDEKLNSSQIYKVDENSLNRCSLPDNTQAKIETKLAPKETYIEVEVVDENDIEDEINSIDAPEQVAATSCGSGSSSSHQRNGTNTLINKQAAFMRSSVPDRKRKMEHDSSCIPDSYGSAERDEFTIFGEYVACRLSNISDMQTKLQLQNQINNMLFETEMGLFNANKQ